MGFKFYTSVAIVLKLKVRKFLGLIPTFVEITGEKLVGRGERVFAPLSWIGLNLVSTYATGTFSVVVAVKFIEKQ